MRSLLTFRAVNFQVLGIPAYFFCALTGFALTTCVYIMFISGRFIYYGDMSLQFAYIYILSYIIPIIVSGFITYVQYINAVVKPIKGGK